MCPLRDTTHLDNLDSKSTYLYFLRPVGADTLGRRRRDCSDTLKVASAILAAASSLLDMPGEAHPLRRTIHIPRSGRHQTKRYLNLRQRILGPLGLRGAIWAGLGVPAGLGAPGPAPEKSTVKSENLTTDPRHVRLEAAPFVF